MKALAARLYGAFDLRLEPMELAPAGEDGILVELVSNSVCMSDYKAVSLATKHKRVPKDIATNPVMVGHEVCGRIVEVGKRWQGQLRVGQHVGVQPALNVPGHELETIGYAYHTVGGDTTAVRLPSIVMEMGCLLPYAGDAFFKCSLAEPISCIVSAFRTSYHNAFNSHDHIMGPKDKGSMLLMGACGAMGLGAVDLALHWPGNRPSRLVVTDIDDAKLARAAEIFTPEMARKAGCELHFVNTKSLADPVAGLKALNQSDIDRSNPTSTGGGYDDIFLFAPVPALITQCSDLLGFGGCLNFFSGPTDQKFSAMFNFYNVHYMNHHVLGSSGGDVKDMTDPIDWIAKGIIHPEVMVTHVGGLDSAVDTTYRLPKLPGGKKLIYTHVKMPMTAIADFAKLGEKDPFFRALAGICGRNRNLWSTEAEKYLLAHAEPIAF